MSETVKTINNNQIINLSYLTAICFLFGYVFLSDIIVAKLDLPVFKTITALSTFFFSILYFSLDWKNVTFKPLLILSISLSILYIIFLHNQSSNYFYTPLFGILLVQRSHISLKYIDKIFILQFILVLYEFITQNHIYTQLTTGLITIKEVDFDYETIMDETGFRSKGLFPGILVATCFSINYSLINRNSFKKTFYSLLMSILINGRLAILICGLVFLYNYYLKHNKNKNKINISYVIMLVIVIILVILFLANFTTSTSLKNFLNVFNFQDTSNVGRIARYILGINALLNYNVNELILGSTYQLFDHWNRPVPPESDVIGMLLEIGLLGFVFIMTWIIKGWKSGSNSLIMPNLISHKFALFMSIIAIIQYRHLLGNVRGLMFWLLLLLIIKENLYTKNTI